MHPLITAAVAAPLALVLLIGAGLTSDEEEQSQVGINVDALPALARDLLPDLNDALLSRLAMTAARHDPARLSGD